MLCGKRPVKGSSSDLWVLSVLLHVASNYMQSFTVLNLIIVMSLLLVSCFANTEVNVLSITESFY